MQYKHSVDKPWKCDECDYTHALKGGIVEHKKYNHKKETDFFFCPLCSYKSPSQNNLKSHDEMVHQKIKRFTCHQCPRQFYRNNEMQMHIRGNTLFFSTMESMFSLSFVLSINTNIYKILRK